MFTIEDLKQGRCAVINDGTLEELREVIKLAFPSDSLDVVGFSNYRLFSASTLERGKWAYKTIADLPTQSVKDFLIKDLKRGDLVWVSDRNPDERDDQRIFLAKIECSTYPFVCVSSGEENSFKRGLSFSTVNFKYATKVEEPKEVCMTVEEIEKALNIKNLKIVK